MADIIISVAVITLVTAVAAIVYRIVRPGCPHCRHGVGKRSDNDYCYLYYDGSRWFVKDVRGIVDTITLERCPVCGRLLPRPRRTSVAKKPVSAKKPGNKRARRKQCTRA